METNIKKEIKIILTLNEKEAQWLKATMQNPFNGVEDESNETSEMRHKFFNALDVNI